MRCCKAAISYTIRHQRQQLRYAPIPVAPRAAAPATVPPLTWRGGALTAQTITDTAWLLSGPAETGKTYAVLHRLDAELRANPRAAGALIRKVGSTLAGTVLRTWQRIIDRHGDVTVYGGNAPRWYDYANGSRLYVGGLDDPNKVLSGERDIIAVNQAEELDEADWETLSTRVTGRGAVTKTPMLIADCNPGPADHWILRRRDAATLTLLESRHTDNPALHNGHDWTAQGIATRAVLDRLTGARRLRLRDGLWVGAEGQYFTSWDPAIHIATPPCVPGDWPIWGALDYGYAHPTAILVLTRDSDGGIWVLGEHVAARRSVAEHAAAVRQLLSQLGVHPARVAPWVAGHDVFAERGDSTGVTIADQYRAAGLPLIHADIARLAGAAELVRRFGATRPLLHIAPRCMRLIAAIPSAPTDPHRPEDYRKFDADTEGRGGDDALDALRYGVMAMPGRSSAASVGGTREPRAVGTLGPLPPRIGGR